LYNRFSDATVLGVVLIKEGTKHKTRKGHPRMRKEETASIRRGLSHINPVQEGSRSKSRFKRGAASLYEDQQ